MTLSTCLFCDRLSIVNVYSIKGQMVPICATHWLVYSSSIDNPIREEIVKYFRDQDEGDDVLKADEILRRNGFPMATDEEQANYKTTRKAKG